MTVDWLSAAVEDVARGQVVVLDATSHLGPPTATEVFPARSGAQSWTSGHIPGSRHIDLLVDLSDSTAAYHYSATDRKRLSAVLGAVGVQDGVTVVCYDSEAGDWAARLWWILRNVGIHAVVLNGGLEAWRAAGRAIESGPAQPPAGIGPLTLDADGAGWDRLEDVEAIVTGRGDRVLVCALGSGAFAGTEPTRYPRAGHIPTSVNVPTNLLRESDGRFLDPDVVRGLVKPVIGAAGEAGLTLYCGAGVSASGLALALVSAGYGDLRIYDGSLEEWTADPARPLACTAADVTDAVNQNVL